MKKSQRLRLSALQTREAASLSETEQTELATLTALAAQHPDPAQDVDEAASPTSSVSSAPTFRSTLLGSLAAIRSKVAVGADLVTARAAIVTLTTERDQARAELATAQAAHAAALATAQAATAAATAQRDAIAGYFGLAATDLAGLDAAAVGALLTKRVSADAAEKLAELGFPAAQIPAATTAAGSAADNLSDLHAQMREEKDPKKLGELAARANALRDKLWGTN